MTFEEFREEVRRRVEAAAPEPAIPFSFDPQAHSWTRGALTLSLDCHKDSSILSLIGVHNGGRPFQVRTIGGATPLFPLSRDENGLLRIVVDGILESLADPHAYMCHLTSEDRRDLNKVTDDLAHLFKDLGRLWADYPVWTGDDRLSGLVESVDPLEFPINDAVRLGQEIETRVDFLHQLSQVYSGDPEIEKVPAFMNWQGAAPNYSTWLTGVLEKITQTRSKRRFGIGAYIVALMGLLLYLIPQVIAWHPDCVEFISPRVELTVLTVLAFTVPFIWPLLRLGWELVRGNVEGRSAFPGFLRKWYRAAPTLTVVSGLLVLLCLYETFGRYSVTLNDGSAYPFNSTNPTVTIADRLSGKTWTSACDWENDLP
jgi:hypothetical protein